MPLSEHEQRLLDQIERALYAEDPKFASTVRHTDLRTHLRRRIWRGTICFVVGFVLLVAGVPTQKYAVSIAGFVVMLVALMYAVTSWVRMSGRRPDQVGLRPRRGGEARRKPARSSVMERLEERWRRRWDDRGH